MRQRFSSYRKLPWLMVAAFILSGFSFATPLAKASIVNVTSSITTNTTWLGKNTYVIQNSITVNSGVTLTVASGTVVKFVASTYPYLQVKGTLKVNGVASKKVYFTSSNDNSVGSTTPSSTGNPALGDWGDIEIDAGASSTINYGIVRYGGNSDADILMFGGNFTLSNSQVASSNYSGIDVRGGVVTITTSTISNNRQYGLFESNSSGTLMLTSSTFSNNGNGYGAAYIDVSGGVNFIPSGNSASGTYAGFFITGTTATNTIWYKDLPYIPYSFTVASGTTLTINHGAVVKVYQADTLSVQGTLNVQGTSTDNVYFTSLNDNSIGGITSGSTTSTPSRGDWGDIEIDAGASSTINYGIVRYGGNSDADIFMFGGNFTLSNSQVASSDYSGIDVRGGVVNIAASTISNNRQYGLSESNSSGTLALTSNAFTNNTSGAVYLDLSGGIGFTASGNSAGGTGYRGVIMAGSLVASTTWNGGWGGIFPIILSSVTVSSGTTLNILPDTIVKFSQGAVLDVNANGTLNVDPLGFGDQGPPYFTSLTDDFGGDTNADGTSTTPQPGDSGYIEFDAGAKGSINNAVILYGGSTYPSYSDLYQTGGDLTLDNVSVGSSTNYGIYSTGGTTTIELSNFLNNPYGIFMNAGSMSVASSVFQSTSSAYYGIFNNSGVTSTAMAQGNYWNSFSGPYNPNSNPAGTVTEQVSDYVNFNPWVNNNGTRNHFLEKCSVATSTYVVCSSVKTSSTLIYYASTTISTALNAAVNSWQAAGPITIASTTAASSTGYLKISDVDSSSSDYGWVGIWDHDPNPATPSSTIRFNRYYTDTYAPANQQKLAAHELGHGLGLADEIYPSNVEFVYNTDWTTLGTQDISDYNYLW
jgi:hypothetical protein